SVGSGGTTRPRRGAALARGRGAKHERRRSANYPTIASPWQAPTARLRRVPPRSSRSRTRSSDASRSSSPSSARSGRFHLSPSRLAVALGVWLVVALAIAHIVRLAFVCDDAFISFRYAGHFASGHGIVFNLGERVEGYTNFLWVVVCAALYRIGVAPEHGAWWVSGACAIATLLAGMFALRRRGGSAWWFGLLL